MSGPDLDAARWFARLGLPLDPDERAEFTALVLGANARPGIEIAVVDDWPEVLRLLDAEERDNRQWDAAEAERERMWELALDRYTESELLERLNAVGAKWLATVNAAALESARQMAIADTRFASAAAGAARLAVHHSELAQLADADPAHPFHRTLELFVRGRWPLGVSAGRFQLF